MAIRRRALLVLLIFLHAVATAQSKPLEGKVEMYNNRPSHFIIIKPVAPQFYGLTHAYGACWSWEENPSRNVKNFYSIGYRTVLGRDSATGAVMAAKKEGKDHTV
jgi:hypothetical protein